MSSHLAAGAVTGAKVKNRSLRARDFRVAQLLAGPQGAQGSASAAPSPTFENAHVSLPVNAARAGRLLVYGKGSLNVSCSAGLPRTGLYVDGVAVPGSGVSHANGGDFFVWTTGVSQQVQPGNHTVVLASDCPGGNWTGTTRNYESVSAVLLGGSL